MKQKTTYSATDVERYMDRIRKQHAAELVQARNKAYEHGVRDGRHRKINDIRAALGLRMMGTEHWDEPE